jgi:hypothetical protein
MLMNPCLPPGLTPSGKPMLYRPQKYELYIIASVEFLKQPSAARAPAWIPMSAPKVSWALPISILRLLIREANPAPFAVALSNGPPYNIEAVIFALNANLLLQASDIKAGSIGGTDNSDSESVVITVTMYTVTNA